MREMDQVKNVHARWAAGFAVNEGLYGPNPNTFYHAGMGGTFSLGDPVSAVTVSYTPNRLGDLFEREPRRRGLVIAVYECLGGVIDSFDAMAALSATTRSYPLRWSGLTSTEIDNHRRYDQEYRSTRYQEERHS
jgi:CubicO group peptidase (beta-lactamase class C family)